MENFLSSEMKKVARYSIILIFILTLFLAVKTFNELRSLKYIGSNVFPQNVITVKGLGEIFAVPDIASFSFSVIEEGAEVKEAQGKATEKLNRAVSLLEDSGIEDKDIKTLYYNINPKYEYQGQPCTPYYCPPARQIISGYEVSQTISVKVRETDKAGQVIDSIGELGVSNISGFELTVDDEEILKAEARKLAIEDAKNKMEVLSKDLGVRIIKLTSFSESDQFRPVDYGYGGDFESLPVRTQTAPEIPTGENKIVSEVYLTYEIKSR